MLTGSTDDDMCLCDPNYYQDVSAVTNSCRFPRGTRQNKCVACPAYSGHGKQLVYGYLLSYMPVCDETAHLDAGFVKDTNCPACFPCLAFMYTLWKRCFEILWERLDEIVRTADL